MAPYALRDRAAWLQVSEGPWHQLPAVAGTPAPSSAPQMTERRCREEEMVPHLSRPQQPTAQEPKKHWGRERGCPRLWHSRHRRGGGKEGAWTLAGRTWSPDTTCKQQAPASSPWPTGHLGEDD